MEFYIQPIAVQAANRRLYAEYTYELPKPKLVKRKEKNKNNRMWNEFRKKRKAGSVKWEMIPPDRSHKNRSYGMGLIPSGPFEIK